MAYTTTCWSCGVRASMPEEGAYKRDIWDEDHRAFLDAFSVRLYVCPDCDMPTVAAVNADNDGLYEIQTGAVGKTYPQVPEHIAGTADEAHRCHSIGAYRGAVVLARAVLEATCKNKGVVEGHLAAKIKEMHSEGLINDLVRDEATELRHAGNAVAHADDVEPVLAEESEQYLALMGHLLADVYQRPAEVVRLREAREAAKASNAASKTPE